MDPIPKIGIVPSSNVSPSNTSFDDINVTIAIRKGVRFCNQHLISNFVSLSHLSPSFRSFSSILSLVLVSQDVSKAFSQPHWRAVIEDEMRALEKNHT